MKNNIQVTYNKLFPSKIEIKERKSIGYRIFYI